jgi:uncharacterized protein
MSVSVGEVVSVQGTKVIIELYDESNKETLFYDGKKFKGVSIREHVLIRRGFRDIVALVQGEYLDVKFLSEDKTAYVRRVELKPIGFYQDGQFADGIKYLPMIRDVAFLMSEDQVAKIYGEYDDDFILGELLKEELPISLPWADLFNTHIGIFGNTGSGKSNTLANLYTTLFKKKADQIAGKSQFVLIDFNGEYTGSQLLAGQERKVVYDLSTRDSNGVKFPLSEKEFWDSEVFGILFKATENTQKPFLKRVVSGREKFTDAPDSISVYTRSVVKKALTSQSPYKEYIDLLREVARLSEAGDLEAKISSLSWHSNSEKFFLPQVANNGFLNGGENDAAYHTHFSQLVDDISVPDLSSFSELRLRINVQLLADLIRGHVQFDHIFPLLKRIDASISSLKKVITVEQAELNSLLTVISLRKANQEVKKIVPLLLAKHYYTQHKEKVINSSPPDKTLHLIIDEAHNILSTQSTRELETWKDYRLELFEEIIKEGRKFGFYLTLSSQRPADISPTVMSQIHNFFIHRLVNDRDLLLLENAVSTLDSLSRSMIPNLSRGCAILTGTTFELPMIVQFKKLPLESQPDSGDVNLKSLWG